MRGNLCHAVIASALVLSSLLLPTAAGARVLSHGASGAAVLAAARVPATPLHMPARPSAMPLPSQHGAPAVTLAPASGLAGARVLVRGQHYLPNVSVTLYWGTGAGVKLGATRADAGGAFAASVTVPAGAANGVAHIAAVAGADTANARFIVGTEVAAPAPWSAPRVPVRNAPRHKGTRRALPAAITVVSGNITVNTTWATGNSYQLEGDVAVVSGVTLTIQSGVIIYGDDPSSLQIYGTLKAVGTATSPIVFQGVTAGSGNWSGVFIRASAAGILTYVNVSDAGESAEPEQAAIYSNGATTFSHLTLNNNEAVGIWLDTSSPAETIDTVNIQNTDAGGNNSGIFDYSPKLVTIKNSTISNNSNIGIYGYNYGSLTVLNSTISGNSYNGISTNYVKNLTLTSDTISNSGSYGINGGNIQGLANLTNDTFTNNGLDAAVLNFAGGRISTSGITGSGNNGYITLLGNMNGVSTLNAAPGVDYGLYQNYNWTVNSGATLTLNPGVNVHGYPASQLVVSGRLNSLGTAASGVAFMSTLGLAGGWYGMSFGGNGPDVLQYTTVADGGQGAYYAVYTNVPVKLNHVTITNSLSSGIYLDSGIWGTVVFTQVLIAGTISARYNTGIFDNMPGGATLDLESTTLSNNQVYGMDINNGGNVIANNTTFSGSAYNDIYIPSVSNLTMQNSTVSNSGGYGINGNLYGVGTFVNDAFTNDGADPAALDIHGGTIYVRGLTGSGNNGYFSLYGNLNNSSALWPSSGLDYGIWYGNDLQVNGGAYLTINAGVTMHAYSSGRLTDYGVLNILGGPAGQVRLDGASGVPGAWYGVILYAGSGPNTVQYTTIAYAGESRDYGLYINGPTTVSNLSVVSTNGDNIYLDTSVPVGAIHLTNVTVNGQGAYYADWGLIDNMIPGTTLDMENCAISGMSNGLYVSNGGNLIFNNSSTTNNGSNGIYPGTVGNLTLTNSAISNNGTYGMQFNAINGNAVIQNNTFANNTYDAAYLNFSQGSATISGNTGSGNGGFITMLGNLNRGSTLGVNTNLDYGIYVSNNLTVNAGGTLTINPGVTVHMYNGTNLQVYGMLNATGTITMPISFVGTSGLPGNWGGINLQAGGPHSIQYVTITGGSLYDNAPATIANVTVSGSGGYGVYMDTGVHGTATLSNVTISRVVSTGNGIFDNMTPGTLLDLENVTSTNNNGNGLYVNNTNSLLINHSTFSGNNDQGIYADGVTNLTVNNSAISDNSSYGLEGVYIYGTLTLNTDVFNTNGADATYLYFTGGSLVTSGVTGTGNRGYITMYGTLNGASNLMPATGIDYGILNHNTLLVATGAHLTLNPGVNIYGYYESDFEVYGTLRSLGTAASPVNLAGYLGGTYQNEWYGLRLYASSGSSVVQYTNVLNGGTYGIYLNSSASLSNDTIMYASTYGLYVENYVVAPTMVSMTIGFNGGTGIYVATGAVFTLNNSVVQNNNGHGIYATTSTVNTDSSTYANNNGWGIYGTGMVGHSVTNCTFTNNASGSVSFS